jgi:DNA-binding NarL/FixJ family response regulator
MRRTRLLLADNHGIVAAALGSLLQRDYDVVGTAQGGVELVEAARRLRPDVIVADLDMPGLSGLEALRRLKSVEQFEAKVVFLTVHGEPEMAAEAFRAGGAGYVEKHSATAELHIAIQEVLQGRAYLTSRITKGVLAALASPCREPSIRLTSTERQVVRSIAAGRGIEEIAATLGVSTAVVEDCRDEMMEELGLGSTADFVRYAIKQGLVAH